MRSSRAESLTLVKPDGTRVVLAVESREPGEVTTQDIFQVSPGGAYLAYASAGTLRVRASDGSERAIVSYNERSLMRFSPDGKYLAIVTGTEKHPLVLLDLASGDQRTLATFTTVKQLEWMRDGLVANTRNSHDVLVHVPLAGEAKTLFEHDNIQKFVTAATATRVVVFVRDGLQSRVLAFDAATPKQTRQLAAVDEWITNAAASLDGERIAFTTKSRLYASTFGASAEAISDRSDIHSLWYSRDGRLGYASSSSATILDGRRARRFDAEGQIHMLRFDPVSGQALVATSVHAWDVMASRQLTKARDLLGVDHYAGGFVLWSQNRRDN